MFAAASNAFQTMTKTKYQHHDVENAAAGTYYFDCAARGLLPRARRAEGARRVARRRAHTGRIRAEPNHFAAYLRSLPAAGNGLWLPISPCSTSNPGT